MAVLVAAMMIVATMVPAWAAGASDSGRITDKTGSIEIVGGDFTNETYTAYKILDLASFRDGIYEGTTLESPENPDALLADNHKSDAYAYVIALDSPWLPFIRAAVLGKDASNNPIKYFNVPADSEYIELLGTDDGTEQHNLKKYLVVTPNVKFSNGFTNTHGENLASGGYQDEIDNTEYTTANLAQRLAQAAIYYATGDGVTAGTYPNEATIKEVYNGAPASGETKTALQSTLTDNAKTIPNTGKLSNIALGYYVVNSSMGTLCALDTTNKAVKVNEKNAKPTITKLVQEDQLVTLADTTPAAAEGDAVSGYVGQNDADEGQFVYYRTLINVSKGAENYVLHDKMDAGLTYDATYGVKVYYLIPGAEINTTDKANDAKWIELKDAQRLTIAKNTDQTETKYPDETTRATEAAIVASDYYTVKTGNQAIYTPAAGGNPNVLGAFNVEFNQKFLTFLSDKMDETTKTYRLMVTYRATLNSAAVKDALDENDNTVKLTYGDNKGSAESTTSTATWSFNIRKYTEDNSRGTLAGAHFQVLEKNRSTVLKFVKVADGEYRYDARVQTGDAYAIPAQNANVEVIEQKEATNIDKQEDPAWQIVDTITTRADGTLQVYGLDGDTYYLKETLAPRGYNQLAGMLPFHILSVYESTTGSSDANVQIKLNETVQTASGQSPNAKAGDVYLRAFAMTDNASNRVFTTKAEKLTENATLFKQISVLNTTTTELPSTGGMGTTVLYIVGGMLVILAGAYLFFSRKKTA